MSNQDHDKMSVPTSKKQRIAENELIEHFSEQMAQLCMLDKYSDVAFIVENQCLPAHRIILAARSEYFRALLYGGLSETNQKEVELEIPLEAFKALLKYIYSGHIPLSQMGDDNIRDTLSLANQYGFTKLELAIAEYLEEHITLTNVCAIFKEARLYNLGKLMKVCLTFMDRNAADFLKHLSFRNLSKDSIEEVLQRDSFFAPEVQIFTAVSEWCKHNSHYDVASVVSHVRLSLINLEHLLRVVRQSGIVDSDKLFEAIDGQMISHNLRYRGALWPEENVVTEKLGASVILGEKRTEFGDTKSYGIEKFHVEHTITNNNNNGIVFQLSNNCIINHIKLLLRDGDKRAYSYFIEVSVDQTHWDRVIDYTNYHCRLWQHLYFAPRAVRYIKLIGTYNNAGNTFHVVCLGAMYAVNMPRVITGCVAPTSNIALIGKGAMVVRGEGQPRDAMLNGDYVNYGGATGYTYHKLGCDILVQLIQPYYIGSMRLLLWDCIGETYNFYIETSTNNKDWQIVVDTRTEPATSWHHFSFSPRIMVYIRIIGTLNNAYQFFRCVHLECPSQDSVSLQDAGVGDI